jgi:3D (Asp-Asp-Asp) domain-containing protein
MIAALLLAILPATTTSAPSGERCEDGWRITGYYTPREVELPGPARTISVDGIGEVVLSTPFVDQVMTEGWGLTRAGWYLGRWRDTWHRADHPLDAHEMPLDTGVVAVDHALPRGTRVRLPLAPSPWNTRTLVASDVGPAVGGRHVDVYTGEGAAAERTTFAITTDHGRVCLTAPTD